MMEKGKSDINDILKMSGLTMEQYKTIVDGVAPKHISTTIRAKIQEFNGKHFGSYMAAVQVEKLPDDPDFTVKKPKKKPSEKATTRVTATKKIEPPIKTKRNIECEAEEAFFAQLIRLRNLCPDHLSFDITIKEK